MSLVALTVTEGYTVVFYSVIRKHSMALFKHISPLEEGRHINICFQLVKDDDMCCKEMLVVFFCPDATLKKTKILIIIILQKWIHFFCSTFQNMWQFKKENPYEKVCVCVSRGFQRILGHRVIFTSIPRVISVGTVQGAAASELGRGQPANSNVTCLFRNSL